MKFENSKIVLCSKDLVAMTGLICSSIIICSGYNHIYQMCMLAIIVSYFGYPITQKLKRGRNNGDG